MKQHIYKDINFRGTIEQITYTTTNKDNELREKYAHVYLPYGYDAADQSKKYNILYLMHGGGGSPDAWLDGCKIKNVLDSAIENKEIEPLIVVFPCFYKEKISRRGPVDREFERACTKLFQKELAADLIPAIEAKYHTYAESVTFEDLKASRMHRAFGGFSMGGCTTWYALLDNIDLIGNFIPLSGDCWVIECKGGESKTEETAAAIYDSLVHSGYGPEEYRIFAATGTEDIAYPALTPQMEALKKYTDIFSFSDDLSKGNLHYYVEPGWDHIYDAVCQYVALFLPYLFQF